MAKFNAGLDPNATLIPFSFWELITFLWSFTPGNRVKLIIGTVVRALGESSWLVWGYALAQLTNTVYKGLQTGSVNGISYWLAIMAVAGFLPTGFAWLSKWIVFSGPNLSARILAGRLAFRHNLQLDLEWHEKENTGNRIDRIDKGINSVTGLMDIWINQVVPVLVSTIGTIIIFLNFNASITLIMAVFIGIYGSLAIYFSKKLSYAVFLTRKNEEKIAGLTYESFNNIRTIKTIGSLTPIFNKIDSLYATARALITKRIMIGLTRSYLPDSIASMFRISMFIYIAYAVVDGKYEIGFLTLFFTYFNNVWDGAARLADVNQQYAINKNQVASLKQVLDEPVNIGSEDGKVQLPTNWQTITLKNISFAYGENEVLKNLSLTIKRGQKIGVIGLSGAGKSTLFKLLLKEREGFSGSISFDDTPLNTISSSSYFSKVAVVLQETEVFNFSVTDNITIGSDGNVNQAQLEQALEVSHVKDFLHKLPEGLDTLIGEKGFKLSGGEKQRLGIARAVYKQPELLLLDEATSHLDLESEQKIQDSLHQFFDSVTAIVIAHRLTTIREMDVIVVIEDGQIIEQGSFDELMAKHGRFAELWDKQKI